MEEKAKDHKCQICEEAFSNKGNLKKHIENVHINKGQSMICEYCDILYPDEHSLKRHIQGVHTKKSEYKCDLSGKVFTLKVLLKNVSKLRVTSDPIFSL